MADHDNPDLVDFTKDYKRLQNQKSRLTGGVESRILTNLAFLAGEHYVAYSQRRLTVRPLDENKLHLVFNLAGRMLHKVLGRLIGVNGVYKARPDHNDAKSRADAEVVNKLILALDEKAGQPTRTWELLYWMAVAGVAFEYVPWVKDAVQEPIPQFDELSGELMWKFEPTGEVVPQSQRDQMLSSGMVPDLFSVNEALALTGDIGSEVLSPLQVFVDSSVRSIDELAPDQAVYIAKIRTVGWIEENFEDLTPETLERLKGQTNLKIVTTSFIQPEGASTGGTNLQDLIPRIQGSRDHNDPEMAIVVERYQPISKNHPHGRYTVFIPDECILLDGDNPYEEIPLVDYHWSPTTTNFWTKDFLTDLIAPQRFLNKRLSQLGEQANASIYANELLGPGLSRDQLPADYPTPIENGLNQDGIKMVQRRDPPQLPSWFLHSIDLSIKLLKEIAGGTDLMEDNKFPGQLRGPLAVPMLQEILDTEWGPLYEHIGERTARVKQMRLNRVKKFYPPYRTMHYVDKDMHDEVFVFHKEDILGAGVEYRVSVERGSLMPELRAIREERVANRFRNFPHLYTDDRTGQIDKSLLAEELQYGDTARESKAAQARKLAGELIERMMTKGEVMPPHMPFPFWDHKSIMDELESTMNTTEFLSSPPDKQKIVLEFWDRCRKQLSEIMERQQSAANEQATQNAVAMATQQAAAQAAAQAIESARGQIDAAVGQAPNAEAQFAQARAEADQNAPNRGQ